MRFPMVWRKTAEAAKADVQEWKDKATSLRQRAEKAESDLKTERTARKRATELYSDLYDELDKATGRNVLLCAEVEEAKAAGFDETRAKEAADRIARLQEAVTEARAEARAEKRRGDHLQRRLDDAVGLPVGRVEDSRPWQPAYTKPEVDA